MAAAIVIIAGALLLLLALNRGRELEAPEKPAKAGAVTAESLPRKPINLKSEPYALQERDGR